MASVVFIVGAACAGIILLVYRRSSAFHARRIVDEAVGSFETLLKGQRDLEAAAGKAITDAANEYRNEVRTGWLAAVPLEEVRKIVSGARMQPLFAAGKTRLLHCYGWSAARFQQFHGIGPDSAQKLSIACDTLAKAALRRPMPHPKPTGGIEAGLKLYARIFTAERIRQLLDGEQAALASVLSPLRATRDEVSRRTTFFRWLFSSTRSGPMSDAIAEAAAVNRRMGNDEDFGRTLAAGNSRLNSATAAFRSAIPYDDLQKDAADNPELYSSALTKVLGSEGAMGSAGPESAPAVVLPNAASSDPERAPREPVSVKVLRSTTATYSISFGRLESAAQNAAGSPTSVPRSADVDPNEYWRGLGTETRVGMFTLNGGLLYVGRGLSAVARGMLEPALIDPTLPIQPDAADCRTRMLGYWSSYSYATPAARASYLQWLGSGRSDPHADVGYVFLYFYGLERRALFDAEKYESARLEIPGIVHEVQRLREIYASNNSFDRYSSEFLEYIEGLGNVGSGDDIEAEPRLEKFRVSFALKRKLASFAVSRTPLPANWAYAWYHNDPRARLPMVAQRCPNEVRKLFAYEYGLAAGEGLILPVNKTVLKLSYRPASASFGGAIGVATALPDVSVLTGPYEKLAKIATSCFEKLGAYSRYIGRTGVDNSSLDALLLLPAQVWPKQSVDQLAELKQLTQKTNKPFVLSVRDLLKQFGSDEPPSKARFLGLAGALEQSGVAIEPDLRFGGTAPALDDPIALFTLTDKSELTPTFGAAALLLEVGAAIASADGDFSEPEAEFLRRKFAADPRLSDSDRARLSARIEVYRKKPRPLSTLKRTIEHVGIEMRDAILTFLLEMVHADGVIAPQEIAVMERIYTMFGLDAATLYTRLHTVAAGSQDASSKVIKPGEAIQIDKVKVQKLIADSAAITAKLTVIFDKTEEVEAEEQLRAEKAPSADGELAPTLLGLDKDHGELLATILERAQWTRAEFDDLCADRQLMPDGAIERINEAAYDKFDAPIIEGDDPLEINTQLLQQLAA